MALMPAGQKKRGSRASHEINEPVDSIFFRGIEIVFDPHLNETYFTKTLM